ncbi:MAG: pseudouridine synthase [Planctomycetaceae bacterium]
MVSPSDRSSRRPRKSGSVQKGPRKPATRQEGRAPSPARPQRPRRAPGPRVPEARGAAPVVPEVSAEDESGPTIRLQKFLAMAGVDSRRNCEEYIRNGRVTVDGEVVTDPARAVSSEDSDVRLDSERLRPARPRYFLLNKPKGVLCTNSDPEGRTRAVDLVPVADQRLFTVGRLDENTEGLLLVTNDGDLAQRLAHPRFEVVRRYRCQVAGTPSPETLHQLREGMYFSEGFFRFRGIRVVGRQGRSTILELELQEGKNREIRRLLARVGHKVLALERIAFGPLRLGTLPVGRHRELNPTEVRELKHFLETGEQSGPPRKTGFGYRPGQTRGKKRRSPAASPSSERKSSAAGSSRGVRGAMRMGRSSESRSAAPHRSGPKQKPGKPRGKRR